MGADDVQLAIEYRAPRPLPRVPNARGITRQAPTLSSQYKGGMCIFAKAVGGFEPAGT